MMLVLTREVGESVMIGDDIQVTILSDSHGQITIGFDAPTEVPIIREEIYEPSKEES